MDPHNLNDLVGAVATWQQATRGFGATWPSFTSPRATT